MVEHHRKMMNHPVLFLLQDANYLQPNCQRSIRQAIANRRWRHLANCPQSAEAEFALADFCSLFTSSSE